VARETPMGDGILNRDAIVREDGRCPCL